MNSRHNEGIDLFSRLAVVAAFIFGFGLWRVSHGIFNEATVWLVLMGIVALGMRLAGRGDRQELTIRTNQLWEAREKHRKDLEQLEKYKRIDQENR